MPYEVEILGKKVKMYDLSQPLGIHAPFWPYYPPFEMYYIKRKPEHGVNAQYIKSAFHIGCHLDCPRHFVTGGKTVDQWPLGWCAGPGVIVDLSNEMDDLAVYTPKMIEDRVEVREGDILILHTGWWKYAWCGPEADEERYIHRHPGAHPDMVEWLKKKKIHIWGVDCVSTDHPLCLPIGRWLGKGGLEIHQRVKDLFEKKYGKEMLEMMLSPENYQLTHNKLFPYDCVHLENLGGEIGAPELQNKRVTIFCLPILIEGAESAWTRVVALLE